MAITGADLAELTKHLPALDVFTKWTPWEFDDFLVRILTTLAGDEVLLDQLAKYLNYLPIFEGAGEAGFDSNQPLLPACIEGDRVSIDKWRTYLHTGK